MATTEMDDEERTAVTALSENEQTKIVPLEEDERRLQSPRAAFDSAFSRFLAHADSAEEDAYALAVVGSFGSVVASGYVPTEVAVVFGRHTSCAVRLEYESVALRHVAMLVAGKGADLTVRLWDLETERGFRFGSGFVRTIASRGPICIAVGPFAIWLVPLSLVKSWKALSRAAAWETVQTADVFDDRTERILAPRGSWPEAPVSKRALEGAVAVENETEELHTKISPIMLLAEEPEPEVPWGRIRLQKGTMKERRGISAERLERGLLIGRYARCGLVLVDGDNQVSRVHLLLVRIGMDVWAIDVGSTNGTKRRGEPVKAVILADGDELVLSTELKLRWTRIAHAEA